VVNAVWPPRATFRHLVIMAERARVSSVILLPGLGQSLAGTDPVADPEDDKFVLRGGGGAGVGGCAPSGSALGRVPAEDLEAKSP